MAWEGIYLKVDWVIHIINVIHVILFFRRRVTGWRCLCALNMCWRCSCLSLGGARASPFRSAPGFDVSSVFFCTSCFLHDCFEPAVPSESCSVGIVKRGNGVKVRDRRRCVIVSEARAVIAVSHAVLSHQRRFYLRLLDWLWRYSS